MMVASSREEGRLRPHPLHHGEAEHIAVKRQRPLEVRYLQVRMAKGYAGVDRLCASACWFHRC